MMLTKKRFFGRPYLPQNDIRPYLPLNDISLSF